MDPAISSSTAVRNGPACAGMNRGWPTTSGCSRERIPAAAGMNPGSFGGTASSTRLPRSGGDEPCAIIQTQRPRACPRRRGDGPAREPASVGVA